MNPHHVITTFLFILFGLPAGVFAENAEKFAQLRSGYQRVMSENNAAFSLQREQLNQSSVATLKHAAEAYRSKGQLSAYMDVRKYYQFLEKREHHNIDIKYYTTPYIQDFHQKLESARSEIDHQEMLALYRIQSIMKNQLQMLVTESTRNNEVELAVLIKADLDKIVESEEFKNAEKAAMAAAQAQQNQIAQRPVYHPVPTPTPLPMQTKALLDVDVSKKVMAQHAGGFDYDDQLQKIHLLISIRSKELVRDYDKLNVHVWAFGQDVLNRNSYKMLIVESMEVEEGLKRGHTVELQTKIFANLFDDNHIAQFGHRFYGYLLIIEDKNGKELYRKTSPARMKGKLDSIREHAEQEIFSIKK